MYTLPVCHALTDFCPKRCPLAQFGPGPKTAENPQRRGLAPPRQASAGPAVPVQAQNPLGQCYGCLFVSFRPIFAPKGCPLTQSGPVWAQTASCGPKPTNRLHLRLDGLKRDSEGTFSLCKPPLLVSTPQNGPNAPLDAVFAHRGPLQPQFGVIWPTQAPGTKGFKMGPERV